MRQSARHFLLSFLAVVLSLPLMAGCGSDEEDIAAPAITLNSLQEHNDNRTGTPAFKVAGGELPLDGSVEPDALVEVEVNADEAVPASVSGDFWSYTLDVASLNEGTNTIVVSAEDSVGNKRSLTFFVTKDTTGPVITFDQFQTPDVDGEQTIGGTVSVGSSVEVLVNSVSMAFADVEGGLWTYNALSLAEGIHDVSVVGYDDVDNPSSEISRQIEVTDTAPLLTVDYNSLAWTAGTFTQVNGTLGDGSTLTLTPVETTATVENPVVYNSTSPDSWEADFVDLEAGVNLLSVVAYNSSIATEARVIVYRDLAAPTVIANTPAHGASLDFPPSEVTVTFSEDMDETTINVTGVATAESPSMTIVDGAGDLIDGNVVYNSVTRMATYTPTPDPLVSGETYTVTVQSSVKDELGNSQGSDYRWRFETD